jgi:hypothetical protein
VKILRNYLLIGIPATFAAGAILFLCAVIGRNF